MAHIAFFILPAPGHVNPTLGVAEELVARGHRVTYALPPSLADRAHRVGATVVEFEMDDERFRAHMVPEQDSDEYTDEDEFTRVLEWLLDMTATTLPALEERFATDRPDVIVNDPSAPWTGKLLADRWGIPVMRSTPTYATNEYWSLHPPVDSAVPQDDPELNDLLARIERLLEQQGFDRGLGEFTTVLHGGPGLFYMPRSFQYAGETFDDEHHFVGPCAPRAAFHGTWTAPDDDRPLLVVSLGTLYNKHADFFRTCIETFAAEPWNIVIALGGGITAEELGPVPDNVQVHDFIPLDDVFPHCDLVINHGGMSTAMQAFSYGVPVVAVPSMPEPRATARRITELGLGSHLLMSEANGASLHTIAREVLDSERVRDRMRSMGKDIKDSGGPAAAASAIEQLLPR